MWDLASGEVVDTYGAQRGLAGANSDLVIDRRGLALFTSGDGTVTAWDPEGARRVGRVFPMPDDSKACPDQECLAVADPHSAVQALSFGDGRTGLRDPRSGRFVGILPARETRTVLALPGRSSPAAGGWQPVAATGP